MTAINVADVKAISLNGLDVKQIASGTNILWTKPSPVPTTPEPMSITSATGTAFTFSIEEVAYKEPAGNAVSYSLDNGETWETLTIPDGETSQTVSVPENGTILIKNASPYTPSYWSDEYGSGWWYTFHITCASNDITVNGDIQSLLDASAFRTLSGYVFKNLFEDCTAISEIHVKNLSSWSTDVWSNWLLNAAASGTIYKPSTLTIPSGTSGVPTGWTTIDE